MKLRLKLVASLIFALLVASCGLTPRPAPGPNQTKDSISTGILDTSSGPRDIVVGAEDTMQNYADISSPGDFVTEDEMPDGGETLDGELPDVDDLDLGFADGDLSDVDDPDINDLDVDDPDHLDPDVDDPDVDNPDVDFADTGDSTQPSADGDV